MIINNFHSKYAVSTWHDRHTIWSLLFTWNKGAESCKFLEGLISYVFSYKKWTLISQIILKNVLHLSGKLAKFSISEAMKWLCYVNYKWEHGYLVLSTISTYHLISNQSLVVYKKVPCLPHTQLKYIQREIFVFPRVYL